jgi:hypothetical protein
MNSLLDSVSGEDLRRTAEIKEKIDPLQANLADSGNGQYRQRQLHRIDRFQKKL